MKLTRASLGIRMFQPWWALALILWTEITSSRLKWDAEPEELQGAHGIHLEMFSFFLLLFFFLMRKYWRFQFECLLLELCRRHFPGGAIGKELACQWQCRRQKRHSFSPWMRKITWRRKWQLIPVFLPGLQKVGHDCSDLAHHSTTYFNISISPT